MREQPRVALLIETARGFGRELLRGISRYAQLHGPWSFHVRAGDFECSEPYLKHWAGHGIIARIPNARVAQEVIEANVPTIAIGLSDEQSEPGCPLSQFSEIITDEDGIISHVANHLLERQIKHFAFVGLEERSWSLRRDVGFRNYFESLGHRLHVYPQPKKNADRKWERECKILAEWLRQLPKPVGLIACNDDRGREVLEACRLANLLVPEEVAVLGVDNDEVFCNLADPPLSSLALNAQTAGYRAAELLDAMMLDRTVQKQRIVVEALGVVTRRSTDFDAVDDSDVGTALQYIHSCNGNRISVDQVADFVALSRRTLEIRFREVTGRTILEEIQITRVERAKQLLLETTYPVSRIAALSGFKTTAYFIQLFKKRVGRTPQQYRLELSVARESVKCARSEPAS